MNELSPPELPPDQYEQMEIEGVKQIGKKGKAWLKIRKQWIEDNPASFEGFWWCKYCGIALTKSGLTLDHVISRSRGGSSDYDNLVPACGLCNSAKGSS